MDEDTSDNFSKNSSAVVAGVMTAILTGLLLLLIMRPLYIRHEYDERNKESLLFHLSFFTWFFLSSIAGGFVCTLLSASKKIIHVLICSLVSLALIFFITNGMIIRPVTVSSLLVLLGIVLGNLAGVGIGIQFKKRKIIPPHED